jgi:hypothetical protein
MTSDGKASVEPVRVEPRMRVLLPAELRTETSSTPCRVLDMSRGGACLELDGPIALGREVLLHSGAMSRAGKVMWLDGRRCGIRFAQQMRATELLVQMSHSRKSKVEPAPLPVSAGASFPSRSS